MKSFYDICFVCFEELRADARTINIARIFAHSGKKVAIIAPCDPEDISLLTSENIDILNLKIHKNKRFYIKWIKYNKEVRKYKKINTKAVWANDFYSLYTAIKIAEKRKSQLLYDSREIYSALGPLAENKFKQAFITNFEQRLVEKVDNIIVSGKRDADYLKEHFNSDHPYTVIMNLPPYREVIQSNLIREELGLSDDKKIILYQGLLVKGRGIIPVLRALPFLENYILVLIGWGPNIKDFQEVAKALNVEDRLFYLGKKSYDILNNYTASADIGIAYIEPITLSYRLALPNKLFEYCMARVPSLVSDLPAMKDVLSNYHIGELIKVGSEPIQFANTINKIYNDKNKYVIECERASKVFAYETQEKEILELLD